MILVKWLDLHQAGGIPGHLLDGTTGAGPTAASPPVRAPAPVSERRCRAPGPAWPPTHRAAGPGGASAGWPTQAWSACSCFYPTSVKWVWQELFLSHRNFAASHEPVILARPARGPASTGQPEAPGRLTKKSLCALCLRWWDR